MYAVQCETFLGRFVNEFQLFTISAPKFFETFRKSINEFNCFEPYPMALGIFWSSYVTVISCCVKVCSYVLL